MKARKTVVMAMLVFGMVLAFSVSSYAAAVPCTCTVNYAGPLNAGTASYKMQINLTWVSGAPTPITKTKTFYPPAGKEKEFLAVALTAIANGKKVRAVVDFMAAGTTGPVATMSLLP